MVTELEQFLEAYINKLEMAGGELREREMPWISEDLYSLYERTGNRLEFEAVYFERRKYLAVFGMLAVIKRRVKDIRKLEEIMLDICLEECWALPPHVDRTNNPVWRKTIDLFAAETAQALSEIIYLLKDEINIAVYESVRDNVFTRVLTPFYHSTAPYSSWEYSTHNWCAVCSGSLGSASLYMLKNKPEELEPVIARITDSLAYYLKGFPEDGTCMEGIGYFTYGMTYFTTFAGQLAEYSYGKLNLFKNDKVRRIAEFQQKCYFEEGLSVNFSDSDSHTKYKMGLTLKLALQYDTVNLPPLGLAGAYDTDPCFRWAAIYRDYLWTKEYIEALKAGVIKERNLHLNAQDTLKDAQWNVMRSKNKAGLAIKGGHNDEPHNHNDIGSFLYVYKKDMFLAELGAGEYTKDYFGNGRYDILCNSSLGHSVPIINGKGQLSGREHACTYFNTDKAFETVINLEKAYEENNIESIKRSVTFNPEDGSVWLRDDFQCTESTTSIRENLITGIKPEIEKNNILLKKGSSNCRITVEDKDVSIEVKSVLHSDHEGVQQEVYLVQWEVPLIKEISSVITINMEEK